MSADIAKKGEAMAGKLYMCATPIGNLEDITFRVVRMLKEVDLIAAEDTRHSVKLLNHFDIHTPMTSYHEYNKMSKGRKFVDKLKQGMNIALITDAGTPGISDPGADLVALAWEAGIEVSVLPGAVACVTALTLSGLPTRRFSFEAFLPSAKKQRKKVIEELKEESRTIVLYEAPHRLYRTLKELRKVLGGTRKLIVCREMTKRYETVFRTTLAEACVHYQKEIPKGEYVLVLEGKSRKNSREKQEIWKAMTLEQQMVYYINQGFDQKKAMKQVAKNRCCTKREVYQQLIVHSKDDTL